MTTMTIGRLDACAVVNDPDAAGPLRDRLTDLLTRTGRDHLDTALPAEDSPLVCVRRVSVGLALASDAVDDDRTAREWAVIIAESIARAVVVGASVRYPDRAAALADLVGSLSVGDRTRAWAWAMVGLWGPPDPVLPAVVPPGSDRNLAIDALRRRPGEAATAVVEASLAQGLPAVHRLLGVDGWAGLAADLASTTILAAAQVGDTDGLPAGPSSGWVVASRLVEEVRRSRLVVDAPTLLAWALVGLADARPDLLALPDAAGQLRRLAAELAAPDAAGRAGDPRAPLARGGDTRAASGSPTVDLPRALTEQAERGQDPGHAPHDPDGQASSWAGLLFLIATAEAAGIPAEACDDGRLAARPQSEVLTGLVGWLAPVDASDPAVRVLAGTTQSAPEPVPVWTETEAEALREWAVAWVAATARRLRDADQGLADVPDRTLTLRVVARRGLVVVQPGWVEVTFDAAEADPTVRAAGLDLDPGFVRWLGLVVRYRYV